MYLVLALKFCRFDSENNPSPTTVNQSQPATSSNISVSNDARSSLSQGSHSKKELTSTSTSSDSESDDELKNDTVKTKCTSRITLSKQVPDIVRGSKKRKFAKVTSSSEDSSSSSSSSSSDSEEDGKIKSVAAATNLETKKLPKPQEQTEILDVSNSKFVVSEMNTIRKSNESSFIKNNTVNNNASNQNESAMDTSQAEDTDKPKGKRRRRNRRRKKPDTENTAKKSDWTPKFSRVTIPAPPTTEGQRHFHFESDEGFNVQDGVAIENGSTDTTSTVTGNPAQPTIDRTQSNNYAWSTGRYQAMPPNPTFRGGTVSKGPVQNNASTKSQKNKAKDQSPGNLFAGTQVFNRKK